MPSWESGIGVAENLKRKGLLGVERAIRRAAKGDLIPVSSWGFRRDQRPLPYYAGHNLAGPAWMLWNQLIAPIF